MGGAKMGRRVVEGLVSQGAEDLSISVHCAREQDREKRELSQTSNLHSAYPLGPTSFHLRESVARLTIPSEGWWDYISRIWLWN